MAIDILINAYTHNKKVYIIGNGASASTASHMACDLGKGTIHNLQDYTEKRFKIISLTDNVPLLTAIANDLSFEDIFIQQLKSLLEENDVVIAMSGSGNSLNVVRAMQYAQKHKAKTIGLLGFKNGGKVSQIVNCAVVVNSDQHGPIEDTNLILSHLLTVCIKDAKNGEHKLFFANFPY